MRLLIESPAKPWFWILLALQCSTIVALSLENVLPLGIPATSPSQCQQAYKARIRACSPNDFSQGCSSICQLGVEQALQDLVAQCPGSLAAYPNAPESPDQVAGLLCARSAQSVVWVGSSTSSTEAQSTITEGLVPATLQPSNGIFPPGPTNPSSIGASATDASSPSITLPPLMLTTVSQSAFGTASAIIFPSVSDGVVVTNATATNPSSTINLITSSSSSTTSSKAAAAAVLNQGKKGKEGAIVAGVIVGLIFLIVSTAALFVFLTRKQRRRVVSIEEQRFPPTIMVNRPESSNSGRTRQMREVPTLPPLMLSTGDDHRLSLSRNVSMVSRQDQTPSLGSSRGSIRSYEVAPVSPLQPVDWSAVLTSRVVDQAPRRPSFPYAPEASTAMPAPSMPGMRTTPLSPQSSRASLPRKPVAASTLVIMDVPSSPPPPANTSRSPPLSELSAGRPVAAQLSPPRSRWSVCQLTNVSPFELDTDMPVEGPSPRPVSITRPYQPSLLSFSQPRA